jgi:Ca2+-binding EF-hand superfamily protein
MKHLGFKWVAAAVTVAIGLPVFAQTTMRQQLEARFSAADIDHNGKLTRSEAQAGMPRVAAYFEAIDTGHRGYITLAQIEQFAVQHKS